MVKQRVARAIKLFSMFVVTVQLSASQNSKQVESLMVPLKPLYNPLTPAPSSPSINQCPLLHEDITNSDVAYSSLNDVQNDAQEVVPEVLIRRDHDSMQEELAAFQERVDKGVASKQGWTKGMCGALCIGLAAWSGVIAIVYYSGRSH